MTHLACDDGNLSKQSITKSHLKLLRMGLFLITGNGYLDCVARSMLPATLQTCCAAIVGFCTRGVCICIDSSSAQQ